MVVLAKSLDRIALILRLTVISTSPGSQSKEADCRVTVMVNAGTRRGLEVGHLEVTPSGIGLMFVKTRGKFS